MKQKYALLRLILNVVRLKSFQAIQNVRTRISGVLSGE